MSADTSLKHAKKAVTFAATQPCALAAVTRNEVEFKLGGGVNAGQVEGHSSALHTPTTRPEKCKLSE